MQRAVSVVEGAPSTKRPARAACPRAKSLFIQSTSATTYFTSAAGQPRGRRSGRGNFPNARILLCEYRARLATNALCRTSCYPYLDAGSNHIWSVNICALRRMDTIVTHYLFRSSRTLRHGTPMRLSVEPLRPLLRLEQLFVVVTVVVFLGPFALIFPGDPLAGSQQARIVFIGFYIVAGGFLLREYRSRPAAFRQSPIMLLIACLLTISIASTMWSILPYITWRRGMALAGTTVVGLYVGCRFSALEILKLAAVSLGLVVVATLLVCLLLPEKATHQEIHIGAWRGLFYHKNQLAEAMLQGILIFVALALSEKSRRRRMIELGLTAAAIFVLIMAHSATTMIALGIFLLVLLALRVPRLTRYVLGGLLVAMLVTMVGILGGSFCPLSLVGRDCTITGRTEIWALVWSAVMERPWIGYGFGAFWVSESEIGNAIRAKLGWSVAEAHNAWLDTWLSIGALGVGLAILTLLALSLKIVRRAHARKQSAIDAWSVWSLGFVMSIWVYSLSESGFPSYNTLTWILFIVLAVKTEGFGQSGSGLARPGAGGSVAPKWSDVPQPGRGA
jgi:exopolysaccharide production protein ExoQ